MQSRLKYQPARDCQRFKAAPRALVLIDHGPESLPFHILDISETGLSFRYLGKPLKRTEIKEVDLYYDHDLAVEKVPAEAVSDYRIQDNLVPVRRGSLTFKELSDEQRSCLEQFIRNYTEAPLPIK